METNLYLQSNKSDKGVINSSKPVKTKHIDLMLLQDDSTIFLPQRIRLHLRHRNGNQSVACGQRGTETREVIFSLAGNLISWQSMGV